jgi:hypothetical protein
MAGGKNNLNSTTDQSLKNNFNLGMATSTDLNCRKIGNHFEKPNVNFILKFTRN